MMTFQMWRGRLAAVLLTTACGDARTEGASDGVAEFRLGISIDVSAPAASAPVVATLVPGAPFAFAGRYAYAKAPGVSPNMARFSPANVGTIPRLESGDIVAVQRGGQLSRARLVGLGDSGEVVFRPQAGSPFSHAFAPIPWAAWGAQSAVVEAGAAAVSDEWIECVAAVGEGSWCSHAGDEELDDCASGQGCGVEASFGGNLHVEFQCLLPPPYSFTLLGEDMNIGGCDGSFWGTMTQESGDFGCEDVYNGTWVADDGDCVSGPADVVVLSDISA